jgi:hypothetical protein
MSDVFGRDVVAGAIPAASIGAGTLTLRVLTRH